MTISSIIEKLQAALGEDLVLRDAPMREHTTFRVGGPADALVLPRTREDAQRALSLCAGLGVPLMVLGNGSNLLVRDGGIRGVVLQFGDQFARIEVEDAAVCAQAGALLVAVAAAAARANLTGMEWASGIPGSIGGAAAMNAGAYGGEMKDIIESVTAVSPDGQLQTYSNEQMAFGYRHSAASDGALTVVDVALRLQPGDPERIRLQTAEYTTARRTKQPLEFPSAGSFFKRPAGHFAAKLIEEAGCKGLRVGGAMVSEKHAGFIVNVGGASADDVLSLAAQVVSRVREHAGAELEMEVKVVGEDAPRKDMV